MKVESSLFMKIYFGALIGFVVYLMILGVIYIPKYCKRLKNDKIFKYEQIQFIFGMTIPVIIVDVLGNVSENAIIPGINMLFNINISHNLFTTKIYIITGIICFIVWTFCDIKLSKIAKAIKKDTQVTIKKS